MLIRVKGVGMAKKKTAKKAQLALVPKKKAAKKVNGAARTRKASPRSQVLPGMEQVRNRVLDRICEGIGEERDTQAESQRQEASLQQQAVKTMEQNNVTAYRHAGIELALVPGGTKLRIRKLKDKTEQSSTGGGAAAPEEAGDEGGVTAGDVADSIEDNVGELEG